MKLKLKRKDIEVKRVFQKDLEKSVVKALLALIGIGCVLFALSLYSISIITNEINGFRHMNNLESDFLEVYNHTADYLEDRKNQELFIEGIKSNNIDSNIIYSFNSFNAESDVKSDIVLMDREGKVVYTSFPEEKVNLYFITFNKIMSDNAFSNNLKELYSAVYYMGRDDTSYVIAKGVYEEGALIGFVNIYHRANDWNILFSDYHFDGIITDIEGNIIYSSRYILSHGINKFYMKDGSRIFDHGQDRYWIISNNLEGYGVNIYSLVYYPRNISFFILGFGIIIILGLCWYKLASRMSREMAKRKSEAINALVDEIKIIRRGEHDYRISPVEENEIAEVGKEINRMLDNIKKLNERNTELLSLNNIIEMKQLTEQINPHFLYNTLEIIRYLVLLEPERAERLIVQFTGILRYSINNGSKDVFLYEDMEYIKDYLNIQKNRFQERFLYNIDIAEECYSCTIPKLLLQPIIENSIKYGFKAKMNIEVRITGYMKEDVLYLEVWDNGAGMEENEMKELEKSIRQLKTFSDHNGLYNIGRRLYLKYGKESGISLIKNEVGGLTVLLSIAQRRE